MLCKKAKKMKMMGQREGRRNEGEGLGAKGERKLKAESGQVRK